jgi:hypothetical protein
MPESRRKGALAGREREAAFTHRRLKALRQALQQGAKPGGFGGGPHLSGAGALQREGDVGGDRGVEQERRLIDQQHFAAQIAFNQIVTVDCLANLQNFSVRKLRYTPRSRDMNFFADFSRLFGADTVNILEGNHNALIRWDINASYTSHFTSPYDGATRSSTRITRVRWRPALAGKSGILGFQDAKKEARG